MAVKSPNEPIRLSANSAGMFGCFAWLCILSLLCALILQNKWRLRCRKRHVHMQQYPSAPLRKTCARLQRLPSCRAVRRFGAPLVSTLRGVMKQATRPNTRNTLHSTSHRFGAVIALYLPGDSGGVAHVTPTGGVQTRMDEEPVAGSCGDAGPGRFTTGRPT